MLLDTLIALAIFAIVIAASVVYMKPRLAGNAGQQANYIIATVQKAHLRAAQQSLPQTVNLVPQTDGTTLVQDYSGRPGGANYTAYSQVHTLSQPVTSSVQTTSTTPFSFVAMTDGTLIIAPTATIAAAQFQPACPTAPSMTIGKTTYTIDCAGGRIIPIIVPGQARTAQ